MLSVNERSIPISCHWHNQEVQEEMIQKISRMEGREAELTMNNLTTELPNEILQIFQPGEQREPGAQENKKNLCCRLYSVAVWSGIQLSNGNVCLKVCFFPGLI
jgi:hypothetical protein